MKYLFDLEAVENLGTLATNNAEQTEQRLWFAPPSKVGGVGTEIIGPPNSGAWNKDELWWDANRAKWRCVTAGTPGVWTQTEPAIITDDFQEDCPNNYWVIRPDLGWAQYRYDGTSDTWKKIGGGGMDTSIVAPPTWDTWVINGARPAIINVSISLFATESPSVVTLVIEDDFGAWYHNEVAQGTPYGEGAAGRLLSFTVLPGAKWKIQNITDPDGSNSIVSVRVSEL